MSSAFGEKIHISIFGQSHGEAIGVVIDGLPAGEEIDLERLSRFLARRAPGKSPLATARQEKDQPRFLSGLVEGKTCGAPLCAVIENGDARSSDYEKLRWLPRPSHADYPAHVKYGGHQDIRGGGHFSARLTAPLCIAGGIALQLLGERGIQVGAHIASIGPVEDAPFDPVGLTPGQLAAPGGRDFPVNDPASGGRMQQEILQAAAGQDSVGGVVECAALGLPVGLGEPMFGGVENRLAAALFAIPAVRGVEFGAGFAAGRMRGSQHNDPWAVKEGRVVTLSNRHGGVLGGLSTGMPLLFRVAFKPTPSIGLPQQTINLLTGEAAELTLRGRHDPCVVPRAVPCVEAAAALALLDLVLSD